MWLNICLSQTGQCKHRLWDSWPKFTSAAISHWAFQTYIYVSLHSYFISPWFFCWKTLKWLFFSHENVCYGTSVMISKADFDVFFICIAQGKSTVKPQTLKKCVKSTKYEHQNNFVLPLYYRSKYIYIWFDVDVPVCVLYAWYFMKKISTRCSKRGVFYKCSHVYV